MVELRTKSAPVSLQSEASHLRFPKERMEDLFKMDPLHAFLFSENIK